MKTILRKTFLATILAMFAVVANAYDFEVDGIYYNIKDSANLTVKVTYKGDSWNSVHNEYTGDVSIPASVEYNGDTYTVTSIDSYAFYHCTSLTSVTIPSTVTSIDSYAFYYCTSLTSVDIPNSVTSIGGSAFLDCSLTSINLPDGLTSVGSEFCDCSTKLYLSEENEYFVIIDDILYTADGSKLVHYNSQNSQVEVPESVKTIASGAFYGCTYLTSVVLPENLTSIESSAFEYCTCLTNVDIPDAVTSIGIYAFASCTNLTSVTIGSGLKSINLNVFSLCSRLTSVTIPSSVTLIGSLAYAYCSSLTSVTIGSGVTYIGSTAFYKCTAVTSLTCEATTPPTCATNSLTGNGAFDDIDKELCTLYVPEGSVDLYKAADQWKEFNNIKELIYVESVSLSEDAITLYEGDTVTLTATIVPENATNVAVTWSSSDESIATVSEEGVVTAVGVGEATITVTSVENEEYYATCVVTVKEIPVSEITLNQETATLNVNGTIQLTATVSPETATNNAVIWTSSDTNVATVDENGLVTAISIGEATITATAEDGSGVTASCVITVEAIVDGISSIEALTNGNVEIYDLNGRSLAIPQKGVNIIRYSDGSIKKVYVK